MKKAHLSGHCAQTVGILRVILHVVFSTSVSCMTTLSIAFFKRFVKGCRIIPAERVWFALQQPSRQIRFDQGGPQRGRT